jgi:hypothetical protein
MNLKKISLAAIWAVAVVLVFATVAASQGTRVDGKWTLSLQTENGVITPTLTLASADGKLTGTLNGGGDDIAVTGAIDGNKITFTISPHGEGPFTFNGTLDGDSMKGTVLMGDSDRNWTAARSKP